MKPAVKKSPETRIFAICRALGIGSDARHDLQFSVTGKWSLTEMSGPEKETVALALYNLQRSKNGKQPIDQEASFRRKGKWKNRRPKDKDNMYVLISPNQIRKIKAMSATIYGGIDEDKLDSYCERHYGRPLNRLTNSQAIHMIEVQKKILFRTESPHATDRFNYQ